MALRNFWVEVKVDGRKTDMAGGPRSRDGGLQITLYQRDKGEKTKALSIRCLSSGDILKTEVKVGDECHYFETKR